MSKMFLKQFDKKTELITDVKNMENEEFNIPNKNESNLDINLIISAFQERLSQVTTELVLKEATIKQLLLKIETLKRG